MELTCEVEPFLKRTRYVVAYGEGFYVGGGLWKGPVEFDRAHIFKRRGDAQAISNWLAQRSWQRLPTSVREVEVILHDA